MSNNGGDFVGIINQVNTYQEIGEDLSIKCLEGDLSDIDFYSTHLRSIAVGGLAFTGLKHFCFPYVTTIADGGLAYNNIETIDYSTQLPSLLSHGQGELSGNQITKIIGQDGDNRFSFFLGYVTINSNLVRDDTEDSLEIFGNDNLNRENGLLTETIIYTHSVLNTNFSLQMVGGGIRHIIFPNLYDCNPRNVNMFLYNSSSEIIELPSLNTDITQYYGWNNFYRTKAIIIGNNDDPTFINLGIVPSSNNNAFLGQSPFSSASRQLHGETPYIYVPDLLLNDYKTGTNWSILANNILPISDFPEDYVFGDDYISDSWSIIIENIRSGNYEQYYRKKKYLYIDGFGWGNIVCVGINEDVDSNNQPLKTTWITEDCFGFGDKFLSSETYGNNIFGYQDSIGKQKALKMYSMLPQEIKNAIPQTKKNTKTFSFDGNRYSIEFDVESLEYVWIPSAREMFGETNQYESIGATYSDYYNNSDIRKKASNVSGRPVYWHLRSGGTTTYQTNDTIQTSLKTSASYHMAISENGVLTYISSTATNVNQSYYGYAFGFCLN